MGVTFLHIEGSHITINAYGIGSGTSGGSHCASAAGVAEAKHSCFIRYVSRKFCWMREGDFSGCRTAVIIRSSNSVSTLGKVLIHSGIRAIAPCIRIGRHSIFGCCRHHAVSSLEAVDKVLFLNTHSNVAGFWQCIRGCYRAAVFIRNQHLISASRFIDSYLHCGIICGEEAICRGPLISVNARATFRNSGQTDGIAFAILGSGGGN